MILLPAPQREQHGHEEDAEEGVDRLVPGDRDRETARVHVAVVLEPDRQNVRELIICDRLEDRDHHDRDQRCDDLPIAARHRRSRDDLPFHFRRTGGDSPKGRSQALPA